MQERSLFPTPWAKVVLAILPGILALARSGSLLASARGLPSADILALGGLAAVCLALVLAGFVRERRLPMWSYPALGILLALLSAWWWVPLANLLIPVLHAAGLLWELAPPMLEFALLAVIAGPITCRVYRRHGIRVPRLGWVLLGVVALFGAAQVITTRGVGPGSYGWAALLFRLWEALWGIGVALSAVAIGLPLAWRSGTLAGLMVVAFQYVMVDDLVACTVAEGVPVYGICACTADEAPVIVLGIVTALLFLIVSPIWVLRSHSARHRIWGLILSPIIAVVVGAAIGVLVCRGTPSEYWAGWWLTNLLAGGQYTIAVALAAVIYHWIERQGRAAGTQGHREG